jgi:hypothetical protein
MMTGVTAARGAVRDVQPERREAIELAVALHAGKPGVPTNSAVTTTADVIFAWLLAPVQWQLRAGPVFSQSTGRPIDRHLGDPMQIHDDEGVVYTLDARDAKGQEVLDDPGTDTDNTDWSVNDSNLLTLSVDETTRKATVLATGQLGSAVLSAVINTPNGQLTVTEAIDVIAGDIAAITLSAGTPFKQSAGPNA